MKFEQTNGKTIFQSFKGFHNANTHIYDKFAELVTQAVDANKKKISSKLIINKIRWDMYMSTTDDGTGYKINDAYTAWYARLYIRRNPHHKELFETRKIRG